MGKLAAPEDGEKKRKTVLQLLLETMAARCIMWHDREDGTPYATIDMPNAVKGHEVGAPRRRHKEHFAVSSTDFSLLLRSIFYAGFKRAPSGQAMQVAVATAAAEARFQGQAKRVHLRVARRPHGVYLDLCGRNWQSVKVTAKGWKAVSRVPVKFRRSARTLELSRPKQGGTIQALQGPFPILMLSGEKGSAKSTAAELIRNLADPVKAGHSSLYKEERDLMIAAQNSWIISFDNVGYIDGAKSDSLCRVATNAGFTTRKLYTDCDELLIQVCRPIIVNGIGEFVTRADFLDRCLVIRLPVIEDEKHRTADEVEQAFRQARPYLLGLLLNGVSMALANHRQMKLDASHRMADFERWAAAAMPAFGWTAEEFLDAYAENVAQANYIAIGDHPVVSALQSLLAENGGRWPKQGQVAGARALLAELEYHSSDPNLKSRPGWPKSYPGLGQILARLAPALRRMGIVVDTGVRQTTGDKITPTGTSELTVRGDLTLAGPASSPGTRYHEPTLLDRNLSWLSSGRFRSSGRSTAPAGGFSIMGASAPTTRNMAMSSAFAPPTARR